MQINKFKFLMIFYFILEHVTFLKQMQSLGAKHVLEHVAILRHLTDLNQWYFQAFTQFGNKTSFSHTVEFK